MRLGKDRQEFAAAVRDQASGAMHVDSGTKDYVYTRGEVEALIAMTTALLPVMS